jgi:hypothetical protein
MILAAMINLACTLLVLGAETMGRDWSPSRVICLSANAVFFALYVLGNVRFS